MRSYIKLLLGVVLLSSIMGCAHSRFVEPLEKKQLAVGLGFGGPSIDFGGAPIPIPMSNIEVGYGIDTNLTVHGGWHVTSAFFGNFQMDAGVSWKVMNQQRFKPNLTISPALNFIMSTSSKAARVWPILDVNAYWNYGKRKNYFYAGINNYFEVRNEMVHEEPIDQHWLFSPQIGHVVKGKNVPWRFSAEIKFIAPYLNNVNAFVPYKSLFGDWGSTGIYLGFSYPISLKK